MIPDETAPGAAPPPADVRPPGPVLAVCGWSGAGKTTVLREVIPDLVARGLAVAAVKHDAHGIRVDPEGKDSDRLFRAGADVVLRGPGQALVRSRPSGELRALLAALLAEYDVVLVEGHKGTPLPKVWIGSEGEDGPPPDVTGVLACLPRDSGRAAALRSLIDAWLPGAWREPPVRAGILVGGGSRRMGRPKALLELDGRPFLERTVEALGSRVDEVVLLGTGPVPPACAGLPRLPDPPGLAGPLAGILGAMRWAPATTWIVAGCDQPLVDGAAVDWLLEQRAPGRWAILPRLDPDRPEPLLAAYDARARGILETLAAAGRLAPRELAAHPRAFGPAPPPELAAAWRNVNTPEDLEALRAGRPTRRC